jgi:Ca2+-binding EF-hand superfamily protein
MISDFRKRKFLALFHHLDLDADSFITTKDFSRYASIVKEKRGFADDEPKLASLVRATDAWWADIKERVGGGADRITEEQWLQSLEQLGDQIKANGAPPPWAVDLCMNIHRVLDLTGKGTVNREEYSLWLEAIGSKADAAEVFRKIDLNGDGVVDSSEMMLLFAQFILSEDPSEPGNYIMTGQL